MKRSFDFLGTIKPGGISFGSEFNRGRFLDWTKKNVGQRVGLSLLLPESTKQRGFFEGGVCALVAFYQEGMNHLDPEDIKTVREMLKIEFNGVFVKIGGKSTKIGGSTKGELNEGFLDRVIDWMEEEYGIDRAVVLNPATYKDWRDRVYPEGGPSNFIDYMVEIGLLQIPKEKHIPKKVVRPDRPEASIEFLRKLPPSFVEEMYQRFDCSRAAITSKAEDLLLWCETNGKKKKNYRTFLMVALKKDFPVRKSFPIPQQAKLIEEEEPDREKIRAMLKKTGEELGFRKANV